MTALGRNLIDHHLWMKKGERVIECTIYHVSLKDPSPVVERLAD